MNEHDCVNPTCDCYENNRTSPSYCNSRDTCELYDVHKDHERLESMFWSFIVAHQGDMFHTVRQLPFTYQVLDDNGRGRVIVSRAKHPYTKYAVLNCHRARIMRKRRATKLTLMGSKSLVAQEFVRNAQKSCRFEIN